MSKYDKIKRQVALGQGISISLAHSDITLNNSLAVLNKLKISTEFYKKGIDWFNQGKNLDDATEIFNFNGVDMALKDIINFRRGFEAAINICGYNYGFRGVDIDEINNDYKQHKFFLMGYSRGIAEAKKNMQKKVK